MEKIVISGSNFHPFISFIMKNLLISIAFVIGMYTSLAQTRIIYGYNTWDSDPDFLKGLISFPAGDPGNESFLSQSGSGTSFQAGTWANGIWYAVSAPFTSYTSGFLCSINPQNGVTSQIGQLFNGSCNIQGIAYDWSTGTLYGVELQSGASSSHLFNINTTTGEAYDIAGCDWGNTFSCLACSPDGTLYSIRHIDKIFGRINKVNGDFTPIGPIGVSLMFQYDLEYCNNDNTMYLSAFNAATGSGEWFTVDTATGSAFSLGSFRHNMIVNGIAVPNSAPVTFTNDISIISITQPASSPYLGSTEAMSVLIKNNGTLAASGFQINFQVNSMPIVTETYTGILLPGVSTTFTFTQTGDFSSQNSTFQLLSFTTLPGDQNPSNDTITRTITSGPYPYCFGGSLYCDEYISQVSLHTLQNSSNCQSNGYQDFTDKYTILIPDTVYLIQIINGEPYIADSCGVWIDWNQNGIFTDDTAIFIQGGPEVFTAAIKAPSGALPGLTRMRIRICYNQTAQPCSFFSDGEVEDYTIIYSPVSNYTDIGVLSLMVPDSSYLTNQTPVSIRIHNPGGTLQTGFSLSYLINNNSPVTEIFNDILLPGDTTIFTFSQLADLSDSLVWHFIHYSAACLEDINPFNDTATEKVYNFGPFYCKAFGYNCDEYIKKVVIGSIQNQSTCSNGGYCNYKYLNTSLSYGDNASLTIENGRFYTEDSCSVWIDWNHDYLFGDDERIPVSGGPQFFYTHVTPPHSALTGPTTMRVRILWDDIPEPCGKADWGEVEDYTVIVTGTPDSLDAGIVEIVAPESANALGNAENVIIRVRNFGLHPLSNIPVSFQLDSGTVFQDIIPGPLLPMECINYTFSQTIDLSQQSTSWSLKSYTGILGDEYPGNDTISKEVTNTTGIFCNAGGATMAELIYNTNLGQINNTSWWSSGGYYDYSNQSTEMDINQTQTLTVSQYYYYAKDSCGVWVDWNQNADFLDDAPVSVTGGPQIFTACITVPPDATPGPCRMRIRVTYNKVPEPCGVDLWGEVEDYTIVVTGGNLGNIGGTLTYDNTTITPLASTTLQLFNNGNIEEETTTNANGNFGFMDISAGSYSLAVNCVKPWGGGNAVDALLIMKHFVGMIPLSGLRLKAADVDTSGYVNSIDALAVMKRFVGMQDSFQAGDWTFDNPSFSILAGDNLTINLKGTCFGDVDGSYIPQAKIEPSIFLFQQGECFINNLKETGISVCIDQLTEVSAISLILSASLDNFNITRISTPLSGELLYNNIGNEIRFAWFSLVPVSLKPRDELFTIWVELAKVKEPLVYSIDNWLFLDNESRISNKDGIILKDITLLYPKILIFSDGLCLDQNIPNPFNNSSEISYYLPETGRVRLKVIDMLGKEVLNLEDKVKDRGRHTFLIQACKLPDGVYTYKLDFSGESGCLSQSRKMIIEK